MLITDEYLNTLKETREQSQKKWGDTGHQYAKDILPLLKDESYTDILDYGAGHGTLAKSLSEYDVLEYDPCFENLANNNQPRSFVVCLDVLEHIEPELLEFVLDDLQRCMLDKGYFAISCRPAVKVLSDGRNAHLIVEDKSWWKEKLSERFEILKESWDERQKAYKVYLGVQRT